MTIDVEVEAAAMKARSTGLVEMLDASHPAVDWGPIKQAQAVSRQLAVAAHQARQAVADRVARGEPAGCPVGKRPAIRRVRGEGRIADVDSVLRGATVISDEIVAFWTHRKDVLGPAIEDACRRAIEARPWQPALLASCHGHLGVLQTRQSSADEGASALIAAVRAFEQSYDSLRTEIYSAQNVVTEAQARLAALEKAKAEALVASDESVVTGLIAAVQAQMAPDQLTDAEGIPVGTTAASSQPATPTPAARPTPAGRQNPNWRGRTASNAGEEGDWRDVIGAPAGTPYGPVLTRTWSD